MPDSHVVSGLIAKRSELAGIIEHYMLEIKRIDIDLKHVDAAIKIFDPNHDLRTIRKRKFRKKNVYFKQGECARLVLDALRAAGTPLSTDAVSLLIMERKGLDPDNPDLVKFAKKAAITALGHQRKNGLVQDAGLAPDGITLVWCLSQSPSLSISR